MTVTDGFADLKVTLTDILGQVSDAASDDTILGILGDADVALTGSSISEALRVVQLTIDEDYADLKMTVTDGFADLKV
ncbi:MAG: hypothetical protein UR26_C0007G0029, partial [candidate division TM6 bacterium GW2011_GWF2_32_72]